MSRSIACGGMVALALGLAGCGGAPAPAPKANTAAATADAALPPLVGHWKGTMQVDEASAAKALPPDAVAKLKDMRMEMTFRDDGTLQLAGETNGQPYSDENKWELVSAVDAKVTIKSTDAGGKSKPIDLIFDSLDSFHMPLQTEVANLGQMRFTRVR